MSEKLIAVDKYNKLWIYDVVSEDEVIGRHYKLVSDPSTIAGERWTRQPDLTLYRHEDEVWRTYEEERMKRWIADFDIRDDYP